MMARAANDLFAAAKAAFLAGHLDKAEETARALLRAQPEHADGWGLLAETLTPAVRRGHEADAAYGHALSLRPNWTALRFNHANLLLRMGRHADAERQYRIVLRQEPAHRNARLNLSNTLVLSGQFDAALPQLLELTAKCPEFAPGWAGLANLYLLRRDLDAALTAARRAVAADPRSYGAQYQLASALFQSGEAGQSRPHFDLAAQLAPEQSNLQSARLFMLTHLPGLGLDSLVDAHRELGSQLAAQARLLPPVSHGEGPHHRIRVGYMSPDFHAHSVARFFEPVLAAHDRAVVSLHAYHTRPGGDRSVKDVMRGFEVWRACGHLDDDALAKLVREDDIDILIDLTGHTASNRLGVFARRPARVHWQWFGYPLLTGLAAFDARLTDAGLDPPGHNPAGERLIYLPSRLVWAPGDEGPSVAPSPCLSGQPFTFGSFNALTKVNPDLLDAWATILRAVPGSRFQMGHVDSLAFERDFQSRLQKHGVAPGRMEFLPKVSMNQYLRAHDRVDLMLDSFPYNGGTTTVHALWRGVPVVSLAGEYGPHRMGASLLLQLGLQDLVVDTAEAYVERCVGLASQPQQLQAWRASMRERFRSSPLGQPATVVRALEVEMVRALARAGSSGLQGTA